MKALAVRAVARAKKVGRAIRVLHRLAVLEFQVDRLLEGLVVCQDCGVVMQRGHKAVRHVVRDQEAVPYCRYCFQRHKGEAVRAAREGRPLTQARVN